MPVDGFLKNDGSDFLFQSGKAISKKKNSFPKRKISFQKES
jgi:hypothetical protein